MTSRHLELDRLTESGDDKIALCEETTGRQPGCDRLTVLENCDSDSCAAEFNAIPSSTLLMPQSTGDSESSEYKTDDFIDRYKARFVVNGYTHTYEVEYLETFALIAKLNTVRVLLSLAANHDWPLLQFDVKNAFLHGHLKEEIYMDIPHDILIWMKAISKSIVWEVCCIYEEIWKYLASEFKMESLSDLKYFLRIEVARSKHDAVSVVIQFMHYPSKDRMGAVMHIQSHTDVEGCTDVDWAGSRSKKQKVVSRFSAKAEYCKMAQGVCELLWLRRLLGDLGFEPQKPMDLYCDNKAATMIAHNLVQHDHTKHVEVDRHFIKEKLDAEIISFQFISSEYQLADVLIKAVLLLSFSTCLTSWACVTSLLQLERECWRDPNSIRRFISY
ncbi:unnamed protein product [Prunus armeniaca]